MDCQGEAVARVTQRRIVIVQRAGELRQLPERVEAPGRGRFLGGERGISLLHPLDRLRLAAQRSQRIAQVEHLRGARFVGCLRGFEAAQQYLDGLLGQAEPQMNAAGKLRQPSRDLGARVGFEHQTIEHPPGVGDAPKDVRRRIVAPTHAVGDDLQFKDGEFKPLQSRFQPPAIVVGNELSRLIDQQVFQGGEERKFRIAANFLPQAYSQVEQDFGCAGDAPPLAVGPGWRSAFEPGAAGSDIDVRPLGRRREAGLAQRSADRLTLLSDAIEYGAGITTRDFRVDAP